MTVLQPDELFACLAGHDVRDVLIGAVPVASLDDVIRSKSAANRPKDQRVLPVLYQLRDEIQRRRGSPT